MKLVILDRDGVINVNSDQHIKNPNEWIPIPGSLEAIALLNQSGFRVAVATNQSGIERGLLDMATLNAIHDKMVRRWRSSAVALMPCFIARMRPKPIAAAVSPSPACSRKFPPLW